MDQLIDHIDEKVPSVSVMFSTNCSVCQQTIHYLRLSVDLSGNRLQSFHFIKQTGNTLL